MAELKAALDGLKAQAPPLKWVEGGAERTDRAKG